METKVCTCCQKDKELIEFKFRKERGYYDSQCKICKDEKQKLRELSFVPANISEKKCKICSEIKTIDNFPTMKRGDGYGCRCYSCLRVEKNEYYWEHHDEIRQNIQKKYKNDEEFRNETKNRAAKFYEENREEINHEQREFRKENKEEINSKVRESRANNPEYQEYMRQYRKDNKEVIAVKSKEWQQNNNDKINKNRRRYSKEKRETDINFKLRGTLSSRILVALKKQRKSGSTMELLGCSIDQAREYIENQFRDGMTWDNHGEIWELDHIKAICTFDITDKTQQFKCFHYINLQPLFIYEHSIKSVNDKKLSIRTELNKIILKKCK